MFIIAELKDDKGQVVGIVSAPPKDFKTGSRGFYGMGKLDIEGKRYQVQVQIVEIGSKQAAAADSTTEK